MKKLYKVFVSLSVLFININNNELKKIKMKKINLLLVTLFLFLFANNAFSQLLPKTDFPTSARPWSVTIADFNGDGKLDMGVANTGSNSVSVFLNTTIINALIPTFNPKVDFTTGTHPYSVSNGDLNGDGKPDLALANFTSNTVSVFLNTTVTNATTPTFSSKVDFTTGINPYSVSIGDINGDGKPDLVLANYTSNTVSVFLNTTAPNATIPTFSSKVDFTTGINPVSISIGDINGDGKPDLALTNLTSNTVSVFLNTTVPNTTIPTFSPKVDFATGSGPYSVSLGDINGDGKPDLAVANNNSNTVSVFLNTTTTNSSTPSFLPKVDFATGSLSLPFSVTIGDFNCDAKPDLVVTNTVTGLETVSLLINTTVQNSSTPTFSPKVDFSTGTYPVSVTSGDINGDGKLDLVVVNALSNTVSVFLDSCSTQSNTGSICGVKFNDLNGNGVKDQGELGLANWQINLKGFNSPNSTSTLTDSSGNYCFNNLPVDSFKVSETNQSGWTQTLPAFPDSLYVVYLASGQSIQDLNFGNMQDPLQSSICGVKFNDLNGNGLMDDGEPRLSGWQINLTFMRPTGPVTLSDTTDSDGVFCFYNLDPGISYTVSEVNQTGWTQTFPTSPGTHTVIVNPGQNYIFLFGNMVTPPQVGSICGVKFNDLNGNGLKDPGEPGLANWQISLNIPSHLPILTDSSGNYCFNNLAPGTYTISETNQSGWIQTFPASPGTHTVTLSAGQNLTNIDFGNMQSPSFGSICGIKFNDLNGNGVKDPGEPGLANWQISLNIPSHLPILTDASGNYCFNNLAPGTYTISETNQSGWGQTFPAAPGTHTVTLAAGQTIDSLNFGNQLDPCINGTKAWVPLGTGVTNGTNGEVWALAVIGSDLYVGGNFTTAGGNTVNHVAKWDGSSWSALISSSNGVNGINGVVTALAVIGTDLYAGGWFTTAGGLPAENIAKWDGTNWSALGNGLPAAGAINALATMGNNLYATSYILEPALGGPGNLIVRWDGANWSAFSVMNDYVSSFLVDGTDLYAGGQFTMAGTVPANRIAKWDGTSWSPLGSGMNFFIGGTGLKMMAGNLYAGGRFTTAGGNTANYIAKWDGSIWSPFINGANNGMNNAVDGLGVIGTDLYVSGSFTTAVGVNANSVAKWDGTNWSPLGNGMNDGVWRLAVIGNDLYAGGIFTTAGGVSANYIAKWVCEQDTSFGSICGVKFNDLNGNGVKDPGEPGLANWQISLNIPSHLPILTDSSGNYCFNNLAPGTYTISETNQSGWTQTFPASPGTHTVTISAGQNLTGIDFGNMVESPGLCDSLTASAIRTSPDNCDWILSLNQPANLTGISSIQILCLLPNQFTTGTGLGTNYQNWFTTGTNTFTPPNGIVPGGNLNNFFNMSLLYVTTPQIIVVNWLDDFNNIVCSDTLELDCQVSCTTIISDSVSCVGNDFNYSYSFINNSDFAMSNIEYVVLSPSNVNITPQSTILSPVVMPDSTSGIQNILISGAVEGDTVSILTKFISPDGCCWCYETIKIVIPSCNTICDSLIVQAQGSPKNCSFSISVTNNSSTVFSSIEFELVSGGMYNTIATSSATGWGFNNPWPNNLINLVKFPISQGIGQGTFNNILNIGISQYSSPIQTIAVKWIKDGQVICIDTLKLECIAPKIPNDDCSQPIEQSLICLPNGTFQYKFRIQNNSNIIATGYGINPTTPGVTFSKTLFPNVNILPGQVSPLDSIIISGIGQNQSLCFQTSIFTTIVPGGTVYNYCCHSDTLCIITPICETNINCVPPPPGMLGWWSGDGHANDISGNNNHGTLQGGANFINGKVANSFNLINSTDYISVPNNSTLNFGTGNLSIDAWIKTRDTTSILNIVDKRTGTATNPVGYSFFISSGKLAFQLGDGQPTINHISTTPNIGNGNWHFVAVTVDRSSSTGGKLYVDGILIHTFNPTSRPGSINNTAELRIGQRHISAATNFNGQIDEVELFGYVLSDSTLYSIFNADSLGKCKSTTDVHEINLIPEKTELMQSYPNPFNPTTTIRYAIPTSGLVKLSVYDILGREIAVLVNEEKSPGYHDVTFDSNDLTVYGELSSGVYIYIIRVGDFMQSKKMILMK